MISGGPLKMKQNIDPNAIPHHQPQLIITILISNKYLIKTKI